MRPARVGTSEVQRGHLEKDVVEEAQGAPSACRHAPGHPHATASGAGETLVKRVAVSPPASAQGAPAPWRPPLPFGETPPAFGSLAHSCAPPATELGVLGGRPPVPWPQRQSGGLPVALIASGGAEQAGGVCRPEEPGDGWEKGL